MAGEIQLNSTSFASESSGTITINNATIGSAVAMAANQACVKTAINASGSAPIYACRAWVNFRGTSQSGTLNTSGPVTGLYTATVTGATTFTIEYSSTTYTVTTSGNHEVGDGEGVDLTISGTSVTIETQIRESGNVSAVVDNGTGDYTINFENAMPDANYSVNGNAKVDIGVRTVNLQPSAAHILPGSVRVIAVLNSDTDLYDSDFCFVTVFR